MASGTILSLPPTVPSLPPPSSLFPGLPLQEMRGMGLSPRYEIITQDGLFSIDMAVKWRGR